MTITQLISELRARDIRLWIEGEQLRFSAPKGALTPEFRSELAARKADIVSYIKEASRAEARPTPRIECVSHHESIPLSFAQRQLWLVEQLTPDTAAYNIPYFARVQGPLDVIAMERALNEIVRRHEALRTVFHAVDGMPYQRITPFAPMTLQLIDLGSVPESEKEAEAERRCTLEALRPFDLGRGPLLRPFLYRLNSTDHFFLLNMHHIISDGWSIGVLLRELTALYNAFSEQRPSPLPELTLQYVDYVFWQRQWLQGEVLHEQLEYWKRQLADPFPVLLLPADRPRPAVRTQNGALQTLTLSRSLREALRALSLTEGVSIYMLLLAGFYVFLHHYTNHEDVIVGGPIAGRRQEEFEGLIGFFVNMLVLRTDLSGNPDFREILRRVRDVVLGAHAHQDVPLEMLISELQPPRDPSYSPLFQVGFAYQADPLITSSLSGLQFTLAETENRTAKFDMTLVMADSDQELTANIEFNTDLFDRTTAVRWLGHLQTIFESVTARPDTRLVDIPLMNTAEQHRLIVEWNSTQTAVLSGTCFHELFETQAARFPNAVAVKYHGHDVTYGELNARANQLAHYLIDAGVGPEVLVGICLDRTPSMIVAILGILKAGGAYLPLDPLYPRDRLAFMLEDSRTPLVLTTTDLAHDLPAERARLICMNSEWESISRFSEANPDHRADVDYLAYVIYTSGTTGRPKGVQLAHRGLANFVETETKLFTLGPGDQVLQFASLSFDAATAEITRALGVGATLHLAQRESLMPGSGLAQFVRDNDITIVTLPPSALAVMTEDEDLPSLKIVTVAGEACPADVAIRWAEGRRFFNLYGPTEATIMTTFFEVVVPGSIPPIGTPISNVRTYILDPNLNPLPIGVPGEIHIGGVCLARGYLDRPDLTAEKFIPNPLGQTPGERLYRTGDLARYLPDGNIEFLGRIDHQVKIRGFRIEMGEIESIINRQPDVASAVVVLREDTPGDRRLVAYVVPQPGTVVSANHLREPLKECLPDYMMPSAFVVLEKIPLTPNGKVNRQALPKPEPGMAGHRDDDVRPRTPVEEMVAAIWADVLKQDRVGIHDNFFELGGHSLNATKVASRLRQALGVELPLRKLFTAPTVAQLADEIEHLVKVGAELNAPPLMAIEREGKIPLSFSQQRLWFLDQWESGSPFYNIPLAIRLHGRLKVPLLEKCLREIVRRHESLRTAFTVIDDEPVQVISPVVSFSLPVTEIEALTEAERETALRQRAQEEAQRPFDLRSAPLFRMHLLHLYDEDHVLLLTMHHIISDGWSMNVFFNELKSLYEAFTAGRGSPLPDLSVQYADFALWQRRWLSDDVIERQMSYWREKLGGDLPTLELPTDRPRPPVQTYRGAHCDFSFPREVNQKLRALCLQEGVTLFMALLAAFKILLYRYTGQDDIVIGSPISNRTRVEIENLIGFFVNTLVLRTHLSGDPSYRELMKRVRDVALGAYAHQDVPFEKLVEDLHPDRNLSRTPLFQVMFTLQTASQHPLIFSDLTVEVLGIDSETSKFDLLLAIEENEEDLSATFEYNTDLFEASTIERMAAHLCMLLEGAVRECDRPVSQLPLLTDEERYRLVTTWNDSLTEYPRDRCIHELFQNQATRTPDAIAVVFEERVLTFGELNARANQLAHHLLGLGVGSDALVGICVERSVEMAVGLLGILKAGAAYVPLDPAYPKDRLAFMLVDSRVPVLLTQERLLHGLPEHDSHVLCLDTGWQTIALNPMTNPSMNATAQNLAYVIYTSGSTGRPKGVVLSHRTVTNLVTWQLGCSSSAACSRTLQFAPLSFDVSIQEIFSTWCAGGSLVLISDEIRRDGWALLRFLNSARITRIFVPYVALQQLAEMIDAGGQIPTSLLEIITAGEQLLTTRSLVDMFDKLKGCTLANHYGPSEAHVVTVHTLSDCPSSWPTLPPIGRPIANTQIHLLDEHLQPVPAGVTGELFIGGDALARGYLNRPDATAERFVPDPFSKEPGMRLYRTGDLSRYLSNGDIEFLGRKDQQVKVRGFRIEPGEIEVVIKGYDGVREAVVFVREDTTKRLVGYVVPEEGTTLSVEGIRGYLKEKLPDYMVPSAVMILDSLPMTPSGKVDRRALPAPDWSSGEDGHTYVAPRTPVEEVLAGVWSEVLRVDTVSVHDNFFDLGGHSLLATQIISRVRTAFGVELPLRRIFESPTVAGLSDAINSAKRSGGSPEIPPIRRLPRIDRIKFPVSFSQQRLWFMDQLEPNTASYNIPNPVRLRGTLDVESLENAISEIVRRHESLRTRFGKSGGEPVQLIDAASPVPLPAIDLTEIDEGKREAAAVSLAHEEAQQPFSLADGPLIRTKLLRLKADDHVLLLTIHHIVADGWSLGIFLRELVVLYGAFSSRSPSPLPELPIQFGDYAVWQREWLRGETLEAELAFWKERLGGTLPILDLPTDYPRPKMMTFRGRAQSTMLIPEFSEQLETLCHRTATTPYMVLLAVFETLMFRYTGLEDILVGSPFTNRNRVEIEGLIGFFVNTLVLRTSLSGHPTFEELLRRVRDVTLSTYAHQDVPFEKLVETLQPERDPGRNPIFQVMFALQNAPMNLPLMKDISLEPFEFDSSIAHFDLSIVMSKLESGYSVVLEYNTDLFSDETMMRVLGHFERLLGAAVEKPQKRLLDLPLLQPAEHEELMTRTQAIENRLAQHSAVERCVVLRNEIAPLDQSLVAYLISRGASVPTDAEFDHYLKAGLNGASGSITYIQLDALPLMDDGQLNLSELHRIRASRFLRTSHMQAGNSIQKGQSQSPDSAESRKSELAARRARLSAAKGVLLEKRLRGEK